MTQHVGDPRSVINRAAFRERRSSQHIHELGSRKLRFQTIEDRHKRLCKRITANVQWPAPPRGFNLPEALDAGRPLQRGVIRYRFSEDLAWWIVRLFDM